jgi:hypothetical protein
MKRTLGTKMRAMERKQQNRLASDTKQKAAFCWSPARGALTQCQLRNVNCVNFCQVGLVAFFTYSILSIHLKYFTKYDRQKL